ncbi:hypothetical protein NDU88_002322 [Pleurodeles waltl]|uniref:Uncharacterized protein n=1 Tax=Pleurodeles waltl TaxID=8319 RepID=A0AAV7SA37_PLEWA|nr:hypothetical protein NDU88_002322 [Pleurodeles waltl]
MRWRPLQDPFKLQTQVRTKADCKCTDDLLKRQAKGSPELVMGQAGLPEKERRHDIELVSYVSMYQGTLRAQGDQDTLKR